jgi:hypothetical protein
MGAQHLFKRERKMNRITKTGVILLAAAALAAEWLAAGATPAQAEQYLIVAKGNRFSGAFDSAVKAAGGTVDRKLAAIGVVVARSDDPDFLAKAAAITEVQAVEPDPELPIERDLDADVTPPLTAGSPWGSDRPDLTPFQWARHPGANRQALDAGEIGISPGAGLFLAHVRATRVHPGD